MKKMGPVVIYLLLAWAAQAVAVDDFEGYSVGPITSPWIVTNGAPTFGQEGGGNQYLESYGSYLPLGSSSIPDSDTETTVFFRVYEVAGTEPDCSVGLSYLSAPTGDWTNLEAYVVLVGGNLQARNNGVNTTIISGMSEATWYNIWLVLNNNANTYDVYVTTGSDDATTPGAQKADNFGFRNDAGDLVSFKVFGRDYAPVRIDDIYISSGTDLTIPSGNPNLPAVIVSHPNNISANEGRTALFTTVFTSQSAPSVQWYKVASPTDLVMDPNLSGIDIRLTYDTPNEQYTSALMLTNIAISDAGQYYCQIINDSGSLRNSNAAHLTIYGLIAHWTLDQDSYIGGNYREEITGYDAVVNGTPSFVTGADGTANHAVQISANDGWALCPLLNPVNQSGQMTVSFWAKWGETPGTEQDLLAESTHNDRLVMTDGLKANGQWQHVCMVVDGPVAKLYVNGMLQDQGTWPLLAGTNTAVNIGISRDAKSPFNGAMDDMRLYNYAITDTEVAAIHDAWSNSCSLQYDLTGPAGQPDCTVNLYDLAAFASQWLTPYDLGDFVGFAAEWLSVGP